VPAPRESDAQTGEDRFADIPALARFREQVRALLGSDPPDTERRRDPSWFFAAAPAFAALVAESSAFLPRLVQAELQRLARTPAYVIEVQANEAHWMLLSEPTHHLTLFLGPSAVGALGAPESQPPLEGSASHRLIALAAPERADLALYRHQGRTAEARPDVFDPEATLQAVAPATLRAGQDVLPLRAFHDTVDFFAGAAPGQTRLVWELSSPPVETLVWTYDPHTLRPLAAVAADKQHVRLEHMARTLADLDDAHSAEALAALYEHPAHFVRWTALRALARRDATRAAELLERAADDPHPHISAAARRALSRRQAQDGGEG
jgi:hypothetical protein